jgi:hypothetical protein
MSRQVFAGYKRFCLFEYQNILAVYDAELALQKSMRRIFSDDDELISGSMAEAMLSIINTSVTDIGYQTAMVPR